MQIDLVSIAKKCKKIINFVNENFSETEVGQKQLLNYFLRNVDKEIRSSKQAIEMIGLNEATQILINKEDKKLVNRFKQFFKGRCIIYE